MMELVTSEFDLNLSDPVSDDVYVGQFKFRVTAQYK